RSERFCLSQVVDLFVPKQRRRAWADGGGNQVDVVERRGEGAANPLAGIGGSDVVLERDRLRRFQTTAHVLPVLLPPVGPEASRAMGAQRFGLLQRGEHVLDLARVRQLDLAPLGPEL